MYQNEWSRATARSNGAWTAAPRARRPLHVGTPAGRADAPRVILHGAARAACLHEELVARAGVPERPRLGGDLRQRLAIVFWICRRSASALDVRAVLWIRRRSASAPDVRAVNRHR